MHIKRKTIPKIWPIKRTGTKYISVSTHEKSNSIPLIIVMRDILKLVKNKKELRKLLHEKKININSKIINDTNYPLMLYDSLSFPGLKKYYRIILNGKKMNITESTEKESETRIFKVIGKKMLHGKKIQLNLSSGKNILSSEKVNTGDFLLLNKENKIIKVISLKKDIEVITIKGKHIGVSGKIKEIIKEGENSMAIIGSKKEDIKVNLDNLFVLE